MSRLEDPGGRVELDGDGVCAAGSSGSGSVDDVRCARLRSPRVTSAEAPSGNTLQSFAERYATGSEDVTTARKTGCPRISISSSNGPHSYVSDRASSSRWSVGWPQGSRPAHEIQPAAPTSPTTRSSSTPSAGSGRSTSTRARSSGQPGSDLHSPRTSARSGAGRVGRRTKTWIGGPASTPLSSSRSQRPNQRRRARARGRGAARAARSPSTCGSTARGAAASDTQAPRTSGTCCSGTHPPSRRRASSDRRCARTPAAATRGASTGRRPARRASAGATARRSRSCAATRPATRHRTRRNRRKHVHRRHVELVVDEVEPAQHPPP